MFFSSSDLRILKDVLAAISDERKTVNVKRLEQRVHQELRSKRTDALPCLTVDPRIAISAEDYF